MQRLRESLRRKKMHYLTVQDVIWINLQITKRSQSFNYARLEEATFCQYGYGQSSSVVSQAGRLLASFAQKKPFASGNEATAFVACMAFLKMNGCDVQLSDDTAVGWVDRASRDSSFAAQAIAEVSSGEDTHAEGHEPDVRDVVHEILEEYPKTLMLTARGGHASLV